MPSDNPFLSSHRSTATESRPCTPKAAEKFGALRKGQVPAPATRMQREVQDSWEENLDLDQVFAAITEHLHFPRGSEKAVTWAQGKLRNEEGQLPARKTRLQIGQRWTQGKAPAEDPYNNKPDTVFGAHRRHAPAADVDPYNNMQTAFGAQPPAPAPSPDVDLYNNNPQDAFGFQSASPSRTSSNDPFGLGASSPSPSDAFGVGSGYATSATQLGVPAPQVDLGNEYQTGADVLPPVTVGNDYQNGADALPGLASPSGPSHHKYGEGFASRVADLESDPTFGSQSAYTLYMNAFDKKTTPPTATSVRYLDPNELPEYEITVENGRMMYRGKAMDTSDAGCLNHHLEPVTETRTHLFGLRKEKVEVGQRWVAETSNRFIWVLTRDGQIYAADWAKEYMRNGWVVDMKTVVGFHHSSFLRNQRIAAAGELSVEFGELTFVSNASGHYKPSTQSLMHLLNELTSRGVDCSRAVVQQAVGRFGAGAEFRASDFMSVDGDETRLHPINA